MAGVAVWSPVDKQAGWTPESQRPVMEMRWCQILD